MGEEEVVEGVEEEGEGGRGGSGVVAPSIPSGTLLPGSWCHQRASVSSPVLMAASTRVYGFAWPPYVSPAPMAWNHSITMSPGCNMAWCHSVTMSPCEHGCTSTSTMTSVDKM